MQGRGAERGALLQGFLHHKASTSARTNRGKRGGQQQLKIIAQTQPVNVSCVQEEKTAVRQFWVFLASICVSLRLVMTILCWDHYGLFRSKKRQNMKRKWKPRACFSECLVFYLDGVQHLVVGVSHDSRAPRSYEVGVLVPAKVQQPPTRAGHKTTAVLVTLGAETGLCFHDTPEYQVYSKQRPPNSEEARKVPRRARHWYIYTVVRASSQRSLLGHVYINKYLVHLTQRTSGTPTRRFHKTSNSTGHQITKYEIRQEQQWRVSPSV